jgi:CHASE3 domain sensor protein
MTPQDKRKRAQALREMASTRSRDVAAEIRQLARKIEAEADEQERREGNQPDK